MGADRVFISYRRDDAAGYAGRLEEALEKRLGRGSVFRDVLDIAPGADFVEAIRQRLAGAQAVLVLIGPRWAGGDSPGMRRIDDAQDFVRLEVQEALASGAKLIPVLLPGGRMPAEDELPEALKPLARRNAMNLGDTHWAADIARLVDSIGIAPPRRIWPWALGAALLGAALVGGWCLVGPRPAAPTDIGERLIGAWEAPVRYSWGDRYDERFEFKRHAGRITGTAGYLKHPRAIENLQIDGPNIHFQTRSQIMLGNETRDLTHSYAAELRGQPPDEVLVFRLQSSGGFGSDKPLEFEARRAPAAASAPASR